MKTTAAYLRGRHVSDCWMANTESGVADVGYYGMPCKPLPTVVNLWWIPVQMTVPTEIDEPVLISDDELEGIDLPFGQPNPYAQFKTIKPTAVLDGGILVYDGHFGVSAASSLVALARGRQGASQVRWTSWARTVRVFVKPSRS